MKKVKQYKGFKINAEKDIITDSTIYSIYTKEEWEYGAGMRYPEWQADTMQEAVEFIDNY